MYPHAAAIGADLGRFFVRTAVVRFDGKLLLQESFPLREKLTKANIISSLDSALRHTREQAASIGVNPIAVGVSVPGFIDHDRGVVLGPDNGIKGWKNVPLASELNSTTGLPVYIGNDANLMTVAEHRFGAAKGYRHVIFIALRTGIGGGIIIDGKLYRGVNNAGGEVGMMIIDTGKPGDAMRGVGTLEEFACGRALVREYLASSGETGKSTSLRAADIFRLSREGDSVAGKAILENARFIGIGLANMVSIFAPEIIVLGGGMSLAGEDYLSEIKRQTLLNSLPECSRGLRIEKAVLGADASVIGSAWYALSRLDRNQT
jgi:glucokinase